METEESQPRFLRSVRLSDVVIAAPIFHLTCASLFLIGYCWYFGLRVAQFLSPSDLFSASIGDVAPLYVLALLPTIAYILWYRASSGAWTSAEAAELHPEGPAREAAWRKHQSDKKFYRFVIIIILVGTLVNIIVSYFRWGYIPLVFIQTIAIFVFVFANVWIANRLDIDSPVFHLIYLFGVILILSAFKGMAQAQADLRMDFSEAAARAPICGDFVVLRTFSEFYLVVRRDGKHALVERGCDGGLVLNSDVKSE